MSIVGSRAGVIAAVVATLVSGCGGGAPQPAPDAPVTSTTKVAGAGVLGNQRRPDESCASQPAPFDPDADQRTVKHAAGDVELRGDPQRIVVLSGDQLDALCALGLQGRIVAAALPDGSTAQPSYLGTVVHDLPAVGPRTAPNLDAIRAAKPDLVLGSLGLTPRTYPALAAIAPTVFTGAPGPDWETTLRTVGAATGRAEAALRLVDDFEKTAKETGIRIDATHFQASIIQLTETTMRVYGAADFPGSVLGAVGVDRPAAQRFTDKPYVEIGTTALKDADFSAAEADIVYVSFTSPAAKERGAAVLDSDAFRKLSANRDNRVFAVNDEVWQTGEGIVAARGVLEDLRLLNAAIN